MNCELLNPNSFDVYRGWIVAFVDGAWRHCRLANGFATIAQFDCPNQHLGVFREDDIKDGAKVLGDPVGASRYGFVGPEIVGRTLLGQIAVVRFGVSKRIGAPPSLFLLDGQLDRSALQNAILRGYSTPVSTSMQLPLLSDENIGCHRLPAMPKRWPRTSRSLSLT